MPGKLWNRIITLASFQIKRKDLLLLLCIGVCWIPELEGQAFVNIFGANKKHTISSMIQGFGLIYCFEADSIYADGAMAQLFKDVGAGYLRYPGGAVTTMYHWNDLNGHGWIDSWNGSYDRANDEPPENYMDLDEYMSLCEEAESEAMLGINMSSGRNFDRQEDGLNEAVALLKYCNEMNYDVKYLYLDNENHHKKWSPEEYGNQIVYYVDSLRKYAPDAKLIGNWTDKFRSNRSSYRTLLNIAGDYMDYLDVHWYWKWSEGSWDEWIAKTPMENETEWYDGGTFAEEIEYFNDLMKDLGKPHIKLAAMEWNIGPGKYSEDPLHNRFKTALMQSEMQMQMMQGGLEIASLWSTQWPGDSESDFRFLVSSDNNYLPTPTAKPFELYSKALNGVLVESSITDPNILLTAIIKDDKRCFVYLLNKNLVYTEVNIAVNSCDVISVKGARCFMDPGVIEDLTTEERGSYYAAVLPSYSLTMIEFELDISDNTDPIEIGRRNPIEIYPNPASDHIQIETHRLQGECRLQLFNTSGIQVLDENMDAENSHSIYLSTANLPQGNYFLRVSDEKGNQYHSKMMVTTARDANER